MCGVAGIFARSCDQCPRDEELKQMIGTLHHRGPDGSGFYRKDIIGLAHARLSIIDLDGGAQPIHNEDETIWTVFNGEIFNYIELRQELKTLGHTFYTESDTEVIVHLYEQYGDSFVSRLNGQFAIALWDSRRKQLVLARDRAGILPLFYFSSGGRFCFASEIKALLPIFPDAVEVDPAALDQLMTFWAPVSPRTIFTGISEVSPGEQIIVSQGNIKKSNYWEWQYPERNDYFETSEAHQAEELLGLLIDATRIRLRADVPVGAYLSGGLDSSVLASLIHHHGNTSLRTFSIGFGDASLDESLYQKQMVAHLNADHSRVQCQTADVGKNFLDVVRATETPLLRTAPVPMAMLSGLVQRMNYKVVLTGEGADEVLGGYDLFKEGKIRQFWARQPKSSWRPLLLKRLYPYLNMSQVQNQVYLENFFGMGLDKPDRPDFSHMTRWATTSRIKEFFSDDLSGRLQSDAMKDMEESWPKQISNWHPFNRAQFIESKSLMAGYLLSSQGDRMLMSNSVEGRFPFLDHRVIEFAARVHPKLKMKVLNEKYLLKRAAEKYLPNEILNRYKQPYRAPDIPAFFGNNQPEYVGELLDTEMVRKYGYFNEKKVDMLLKKIRAGRAIGAKDNMALVGILSTQAWHHIFVENRDRAVKSAGQPLASAQSVITQ